MTSSASVIRMRRRKSGRRYASRRPSITDMVPSLYLLLAALAAQGFELRFREQLDGRIRTGHQQLKLLNRAASALNLLAGALREAMRLDRQGLAQLAAAQDDHRIGGLTHQTRLGERLRRDFRTLLEAGFELVDVHFLINGTEDVGKTALKRQAAHQRKLATLKVRRHTAARTGVLALGTTSSRLALAGAVAATYSLALLSCTLIGTQVVQLHRQLLHFFNRDQVLDLGQHPADVRGVRLLHHLVKLIQSERAHGIVLALSVADGALHQLDPQ